MNRSCSAEIKTLLPNPVSALPRGCIYQHPIKCSANVVVPKCRYIQRSCRKLQPVPEAILMPMLLPTANNTVIITDSGLNLPSALALTDFLLLPTERRYGGPGLLRSLRHVGEQIALHVRNLSLAPAWDLFYIPSATHLGSGTILVKDQTSPQSRKAAKRS